MTTFKEIYDRAIFRISDYSFLNLEDSKREQVLRRYLMSAQSEFVNSCAIDLNDYNEDLKQFNNTLGDEVVEILSLGIAYYWLSAKTLNSELLRNVITSKNYTSYSPANLLKETQNLRKELQKEFQGKIKLYSIRHSSLETLKV